MKLRKGEQYIQALLSNQVFSHVYYNIHKIPNYIEREIEKYMQKNKLLFIRRRNQIVQNFKSSSWIFVWKERKYIYTHTHFHQCWKCESYMELKIEHLLWGQLKKITTIKAWASKLYIYIYISGYLAFNEIVKF